MAIKLPPSKSGTNAILVIRHSGSFNGTHVEKYKPSHTWIHHICMNISWNLVQDKIISKPRFIVFMTIAAYFDQPIPMFYSPLILILFLICNFMIFCSSVTSCHRISVFVLQLFPWKRWPFLKMSRFGGHLVLHSLNAQRNPT
jgi:hypothetical protein